MGRYGRVLTGVFGVRERASKCEEHPVILPRLQDNRKPLDYCCNQI